MRKTVEVICLLTFATAFTSLSTILTEVEAVKLTSVNFPDVIRNGSVSDVVLDCEYSIDDKDKQPGKLPVVKWFFNGDPQPVYQWIPPDQKPQDLGVLKGRLNLDYRASKDRNTMHRALQIVNPTTELSGEYMCQISTFDEEQTLSKKMIIFEPEKSFEIVSIKGNDNTVVNITCIAEGIFPEPKLTIVSNDGEFEQEISKVKRDGVYDIVSSVTVDDESLPSPTQFSCELSIPEANYTRTTNLSYYPGPPTTTTAPEPPDASTEYVPDANLTSVANSADCQYASQYAWLLLMAAHLLCYRL